MKRRLASLLTLPVLATFLFILAKVAGWWPLRTWSWVWVLSPLWVDGLTLALVFGVSWGVDQALRLGVSLLRVSMFLVLTTQGPSSLFLGNTLGERRSDEQEGSKD